MTSEKKYIDPMEEWNETMISILGKEKWESLNYWQKTCEVAALQEWRRDHPHWISELFGLKIPHDNSPVEIIYGYNNKLLW